MRQSGGSSELFNSDSIKCTVRISLYQRSWSWDRDANNAWPPVFANTGLGGMIIRINHEKKLNIIMNTNLKINTTTWLFTTPVSQIRKLLDDSLYIVPYIFNTNDLNLSNNSLIFIMKTDIIFLSYHEYWYFNYYLFHFNWIWVLIKANINNNKLQWH